MKVKGREKELKKQTKITKQGETNEGNVTLPIHYLDWGCGTWFSFIHSNCLSGDSRHGQIWRRMDVVRALARVRVVMTVNNIILCICHRLEERQENVLGITTGLDDRGSILGGARDFSLLHSIQDRL
jgi:hypothetical protein